MDIKTFAIAADRLDLILVVRKWQRL